MARGGDTAYNQDGMHEPVRDRYRLCKLIGDEKLCISV